MLPPHQGLGASDPTGLDINRRLIVSLEFAPRHWLPQFIFEQESLDAMGINVV